jgi:hypothetical protein
VARNLIVLGLVLGIGVFYLGTVREGVRGGDDDAMYIHHARNIATGVAYAETGYILNPRYLDLGPQSYPPGYPLLLVPIYRWKGVDFAAMTRETIALFLAFLYLYFMLIRRSLSYPSALIALAATGVCPIFWEFKENIASDFPFLLFVFASLLLLDRYHRGEAHRLPRPLYALIVALLVWFSSAVRAIGLVLIPALLLHDLLKYRKITRFTIQITAVTGICVLLQVVLFPGAGSYAEGLGRIGVGTALYNVVKYAKALTAVWDNGYSTPVRLLLFGLTGSAAVVGFVKRFAKRLTVIETFLPLYLAALVVSPWSAARYLFPVIPLYVFYVFVGVEEITARVPSRTRRSISAVLACAVFATFGAKYTTVQYGPLEGAATKVHAEDLYRYVRATTRATDVFVARRPRALSLYTGRSASMYHQPSDDADLWSYLNKIGADYLVTGPDDSEYYRAFLERSRDRLEVVYENPQFTLLAVDWTTVP